MTKAGKSLFYFGVYVALLGAAFIAVPQLLLQLVKLPPMPAGWARVVGLLAFIIGTCDILCGKNNITLIIRASVYIRLCFIAGIILLVLTGQMPLQTLLFALPDLLGVIWTAIALKQESTNNKI